MFCKRHPRWMEAVARHTTNYNSVTRLISGSKLPLADNIN